MSKHEEREASLKLLELVQALLVKDSALRDAYDVRDKFRYVHQKLEALQQYVQTELQHVVEEVLPGERVILEDERLVYVYLFNAHGLSLSTWKKMMHASVFYEYSINRPIYATQSEIQSFIRQRTDKAQHGYLSVIVKKTDVLSEHAKKDAQGAALLRVREGCLKVENTMHFFHSDHVYVFSNGEFVQQ